MGNWEIKKSNEEQRAESRAKTKRCKICKNKFMQQETGQEICPECLEDLDISTFIYGKDQY